MDRKLTDAYARLILEKGVNLQRGQAVVIQVDAEFAGFAERMAELAYELGAGEVEVRFESAGIARLRYLHAPARSFARQPPFRVEGVMHYLRRGACLITLQSAAPDNLSGADPEKLRLAAAAAARAQGEYRDYVTGGRSRWCVAALPGERWARGLFGGESDPVGKLWSLILRCSRVEDERAGTAWEEHMRRLGERARAVEALGLRSLRFTAGDRTDFTISPAWPDAWVSGRERCDDGVWFSPNIPTEEIWTTPHKHSAEGTVAATMPVIAAGGRIEGLWLRLRGGLVVEYGCDTGREALENLLALSPSMKRLGEVALVDRDSPVGQAGILFENTLYDENASCHLALGAGAPIGRRNDPGRVNAAPGHVDFMFGAPDLRCVGLRADGREVAVMEEGRIVV